MPGGYNGIVETKNYNDNDQTDRVAASTLGSLLRLADKNSFKEGDHSYYSGHELVAKGVTKEKGTEYRKKDIESSGKTDRGKHRVVIKVDSKTKEPKAGEAYIWYHDGRIRKLDKGFFEKAEGIRKMK